METKRRRRDILPLVIIASFSLLGATHFACRFDVSSHIENVFRQAWAEPLPQKSAQPGQPADGSIPEKEASPEIRVETIARNPFMAPMDYVVKRENLPAKYSGRAGSLTDSPVPAEPVLKGIVRSGASAAAIIEYAGLSGFYRTGQSVGGMTVGSIGEKYVTLDGQTYSF